MDKLEKKASGEATENEGLRAKALEAWRAKKEFEDTKVEERIAEEEYVLREKLIELGAVSNNIMIKHKGGRIIAETEGIRFISAYNDPYLTTLSCVKNSKLPGLMLLWTCPDCGREIQGKLIREPVDLGEELERIGTGTFHSYCGYRENR